MAQCQRAIDIEIETVAGYQKKAWLRWSRPGWLPIVWCGELSRAGWQLIWPLSAWHSN